MATRNPRDDLVVFALHGIGAMLLFVVPMGPDVVAGVVVAIGAAILSFERRLLI